MQKVFCDGMYKNHNAYMTTQRVCYYLFRLQKNVLCCL